MPLGNCLSVLAVTIEVVITRYINFSNAILDTVNKQINTGFTKKGICILFCLKELSAFLPVLQCKGILHIPKVFGARRN